MNNIYDIYSNKLKSYESLIKEQEKSIITIAYLRLATLIIGISVAFYTFRIKSYAISLGVFALSLIIFIYLIIKHDKEINKKNYSVAMKTVNERALKRLTGEWKEFQEDGSEFRDGTHSYSEDLDIFGKGSLFQWINSTRTFIGKESLKNRLTKPLKTASQITMTQQALQELAANLEWRQLFEAEGLVVSDNCNDPKELYEWAKGRNELYSKLWLIILVRIIPAITLCLIGLYFFTSLISLRVVFLMLTLNLAILFAGSKKRSATFHSIYKYKNSISIYSKLIELIENKDFHSDYLKELKGNLSVLQDEGAVKAIKQLSNIYDKASDRRNLIYFIINILFLWDYQSMIAFEKWRVNSGKDLEKWLQAVGEFEALISISSIIHDNPAWTMPLISEKDFIVKAEHLGHPLLGEKRVCNDITIDREKNILIITGSNMSGKSTFLRTVGINLVLSYIGASVCAKDFQCSIMSIFTCMRTSDNLENSISSFYAEILRIKMIVKGAKEEEKVFFLLDELFKGTNSADRHEGAKALIKQLGKQGATGMISTHDLELCDLEKEYSKIRNYHFKEYYINDELKFDYKIRKGPSTTRNALYLIKLAGIEV